MQNPQIVQQVNKIEAYLRRYYIELAKVGKALRKAEEALRQLEIDRTKRQFGSAESDK